MRSVLRFDIWREWNNKRIRLDANFVEIEFHDRRLYDRMFVFYNATVTAPHLEHIHVHACTGCLTSVVLSIPFNEDRRRNRLTPIGLARKPNTVDELITAIKHICESLLGLHELEYIHHIRG